MTQETICPACGAPLVISGEEDEVECTFCGADLKVHKEDGQAVFQVVAQPEPQKETLSRPVEGHGGPAGGAKAFPTDQVEPTPGEERSGISTTGPFPSGPSFAPQVASGGAVVYPAGTERKGTSSATPWIVAGGALLLGLILLCACLAFVIMALVPYMNF